MANNLIITTPRSTAISVPFKGGAAKAELVWKPDFGKNITGNFQAAQRFIDNEVLRFGSARVPFQTGMLQKSGILGTVIGSGEVRYVAPYAGHQYYKTAKSRSYDANRGGMWFERGKASERERILEGARKIAGGGQ